MEHSYVFWVVRLYYVICVNVQNDAVWVIILEVDIVAGVAISHDLVEEMETASVV